MFRTLRESTVVYPPPHNRWSQHMFVLAYNESQRKAVQEKGHTIYDGTYKVTGRRQRAR